MKSHRRVVGARRELGVCRAEAEPSDWVGTVRDEMLHRRHRGLKKKSNGNKNFDEKGIHTQKTD